MECLWLAPAVCLSIPPTCVRRVWLQGHGKYWDSYRLASFSWSSSGSSGSCYPRLTLWTHFTLEKRRKSKRGIRACGAGTSLQVHPNTGHEDRALDHSRPLPMANVGDWESDEVMWKVDRFFKEEEGKEKVTLGGLFIIWERQLLGSTHFGVPNHHPEWPK